MNLEFFRKDPGSVLLREISESRQYNMFRNVNYAASKRTVEDETNSPPAPLLAKRGVTFEGSQVILMVMKGTSYIELLFLLGDYYSCLYYF